MKVLVDPSVWSLQRKREYLSSFPAKFLIEKDRVFTENANRPHGYGLIDPNSFSPFPKNPLISRFFREIGLAEELGSGVRNLYKYTKFILLAWNPACSKQIFLN